MAKQRFDDEGNLLPKRIYKKGKCYHLVIKNKWVNLGRDYRSAIKRGQDAMLCRGIDVDSIEIFDDYLRKIYSKAKGNAKGYGKYRRPIPFEIASPEFVVNLAAKQDYRCAVTGTRFSLAFDPASQKRPMAPSLDRIDCNGGYTEDNVRLVCQITNIALNAWGERYLLEMAENYVKHVRRAN